MNTGHEGTNLGGTLGRHICHPDTERPVASQEAHRKHTATGGGLMAQVADRWRIKTRSATHSNTPPQAQKPTKIPHGWQMWQVFTKLTHMRNSKEDPCKGEETGTWVLHRGKPATSATHATPRPGMSQEVLA